MRNHIYMAWLAAWVGFASLCFGQSTLPQLTITFDGQPVQAPYTAAIIYEYAEAGMYFDSLSGGGFVRVGSPELLSFYPASGSGFLRADAASSLSFVFTNGTLFDLNSVDLAEYSTVAVALYGVQTVHFVGYHTDGSTIETDLTPDGIIDGTGPLADFQTFTFTGWNNLTRVDIPTYGWSLDNLVVTPAPEPETIWLGVLGAGLLLFVCKRRKSNGVTAR
jgi:hypothetical protein